MPINRTDSFESFLTQNRLKPFPGIAEALNAKRIPFKNNTVFMYNPGMLAAKEWNRCVDFYLDKTPGGNMMDLMNIMGEIYQDEAPHVEELEELAVDIVREMYNVPESILMIPKIDFPSGQNLAGGIGDEDNIKELTEEQKFNLEPLIQKRIILNSLIHGAAVHQWTSAFHIGYDKLQELNPNLIEHYNSYASLINFYNWQHPMALSTEEEFDMAFNIGRNNNRQRINEEQHNQENNDDGGGMTQGYNEINIQESKINAVGVNFPVLIHELSKGALEYLLSRSIPSNLSEEELAYLYAESDKYSHEFWHYYMGPTLWRGLIAVSDIETQELPKLLSYISTMDYEELSDLMLKIMTEPEKEGKELINKIKNQIK